jgi:UMF1 family MFS transporter
VDKQDPSVRPSAGAIHLAPRLEIFAWAMYDFANSGYTTIVLTAIFNAYFVSVVAQAEAGHGLATLYWTVAMGVANGVVLLTAPVVGAIADFGAHKKRFLAATTIGCVVFTSLLALVGPGDVVTGMLFVIVATIMFSAGENLIAAFLPEIAPQEDMGRISGYGWSLGYLGGLLVLGLCLAYVSWAERHGQTASQYVPVTMLITAGAFALASLPTFIWLRERAVGQKLPPGGSFVRIGFERVAVTWTHIRRFQDLFRFLLTVTVFHCGIYTVIVVAAVYAREVMGFDTKESLFMILIVNVTSAVGAFIFGRVQDYLGSIRTLMLTLLLWTTALMLAFLSSNRTGFWVSANLIGLAMGSSQSASRALVGQFSPPERSGEFFGMWGLAVKLAAVIGPMSYGIVTVMTHGNHRMAILVTAAYFIVGALMLLTVNERRGRETALAVAEAESAGS